MTSRLLSFHTCSSSVRVSAVFAADTFGLVLKSELKSAATAKTPTGEVHKGPSHQRPQVRFPSPVLSGPVLSARLRNRCQGSLSLDPHASSGPDDVARNVWSGRSRMTHPAMGCAIACDLSPAYEVGRSASGPPSEAWPETVGLRPQHAVSGEIRWRVPADAGAER